jgi:HSP20 family protein
MSRVEDADLRPSQEDDFFDVLFDRAGNPARSFRMEGGIGWRPATNVWETDSEIVVQADLAGLEREVIEVWIDGSRLLIRGTRPDPGRGGRTHFHKLEIPSGPFERWIALPEGIEASRARARYARGFLLIRIPFGGPEPPGRRSIAIETRD